MMLHVYSRSREGDTPLSAHFKAREFACADGSDPIFIDDELVTLLEVLRLHFGRPVVVTSGFRTAAHNARTAALALALTNQLLSATGHAVLPIESAQLEQLVSTGLTMAAALVSWWENNSFTPEAIEADGYLNQLKQK